MRVIVTRDNLYTNIDGLTYRELSRSEKADIFANVEGWIVPDSGALHIVGKAGVIFTYAIGRWNTVEEHPE